MKERFSWYLRFSSLNVYAFWLLGLPMLCGFFPLELVDTHWLGKLFITLYISITYLAYLGCIPFLILLPALLIPTKRLMKLASLTLISLAAMYFLVDTIVFQLYRFHLNGTLLEFVFGGQAIEMFGFSPQEWRLMIVVGLVIVASEIGIAILATRRSHRLGTKSLLIMTGALVFSYLTLILSMGYGISAFSQQARVFPFYPYLLSKVLRIDPTLFEQFAAGRFVQLKESSGPLHYPLQPLQCRAPTKPMNIVFIGIDAWRFDQLKEEVMPATHRWSQDQVVFANHYSGGNNTRSGLFSWFYGLPSTYWTAFLRAERGPVLVEQLKALGYHFGIFSSGELLVPPFDRTVFAAIRPIQTIMPGSTPVERDHRATQQFLDFVSKTPSPFFAFLFYITPQSYCYDQPLPARFTPSISSCLRMTRNNQTDPVPYFNRYRNALLSVDQELQKVLKVLDSAGLKDHTIVILTSDHGQEFNDNHHNDWEHASNYTNYQMQVPLIVHWPGKAPATVKTQTSHYDIATTLLREAFQCQNPSEDYSVGYGLFNPTPRPYLIATSYVNFAVLEPDRINIIQTSGQIDVQDLQGSTLQDAKPRFPVLQQALQDLRRFY